MASFDQYNCTFHEVDPIRVMQVITGVFPYAEISPDRAKHGYRVGQVFKQGEEALVRVWWEGNPGVHVIAHNRNAQLLAPHLRAFAPHQVTRLDCCEDWIEAGFFDKLAAYFIDYAQRHGLKIDQKGDWARGQARTLNIGSRKSPVMLRIYEKGYQVGGNPDWVRLEVEIKPGTYMGRCAVSTWTAQDCFSASTWLTDALQGLGFDHLQAHSIGTVYRPSDEERARHALAKQYGKVIARWVNESGDKDVFASELLELVGEVNEAAALLIADNQA